MFRWFESWARTWHCSSNHAEVAPHMPQLEGPTTKNIQLCTGGLWGGKGKKKLFKIKVAHVHTKESCDSSRLVTKMGLATISSFPEARSFNSFGVYLCISKYACITTWPFQFWALNFLYWKMMFSLIFSFYHTQTVTSPLHCIIGS